MSEFPVVSSKQVFDGSVIAVRIDEVRMPDGSTATREIVDHPGAVGIVALDDDENVVLVNQYRPALGRRLDELPAGLLDVDGEAPLVAAKRELAEEAGLAAEHWDVLLDLNTSPGFSDEAIRIYLARDLHEAGEPDGFEAEHEEVSMTVTRVPLATAVERVFAGQITNAAAAAGIVAAAQARTSGFAGLRPADAPWADHP
jgi:8-oxo-dGTP pyrophosphatase MutT (NUDIX family)